MKFRQLTDTQILALAIDEWLMDLDDEEWEAAMLHIEERIKQRAMRKAEQSKSRTYRAKPRKTPISPQDILEPI